MRRADATFFRRDPFLRQLVTALRPLRPQAIILFGSRARGDALAWSDYDVIVVRSTRLPFIDRLTRVSPYIRRLPRPVQVLVYTPDEFRRLLSDTFFGHILQREGVVLYVGSRASQTLVSGGPG